MNDAVVIVGAGASGLMCAMTAAQRGRKVVVLDHQRRPGEKIRISGGGRCNFTNLHTAPHHYLSANPNFCISALSRYTPGDFLALLAKHGVATYEKKMGQLFCTGSAHQVVEVLLGECRQGGVTFHLGVTVDEVQRQGEGFVITAGGQRYFSQGLVVATGGSSYAKLGATDFGHRLARSLGVKVIPPRPGLVPLTFDGWEQSWLRHLAGISLDAKVSCGAVSYQDGLLFTHRGLSGPAILQLSSHWQPGQGIAIDFTPEVDILAVLKSARQGKREVVPVLAGHLPHRLAEIIARQGRCSGRIADMNDGQLATLANLIKACPVTPTGTQGYRLAEVTVGGVDTRELSSKTMGCKKIPGLYFTGEVVDVTGELGGFNLQWAWSSGHAAGTFV